MIQTQHLLTFEAVIRTGTFASAARELGYTQPAISQQIRALEKDLNAVLFVRAGRGLKLSPGGEVLASRVPSLLAELLATEERVAAVRRLQDGRVRVCAFPSAHATLVPAAMSKMRADHLDIEIELFEAEPPESVEGLRAGDYDVVVTFRYEDYSGGEDEREDEDLLFLPLAAEPLVVLTPDDHPVTRRQQVNLAELKDERWIAGCVRCRQAFVQACYEAGFSPRIDITTDDSLAVQSYVVAGLGLAVMPQMTQAFVRHPRLRVRRLSPVRNRAITATVRNDIAPALAVQHMLESLRWAAQQTASSPIT